MEIIPAEKIADHLDSPDKKLVLFHATWCGFCRRFIPIFIAREKHSGLPFVQVDISDEDAPVWDDYGIEVVPTLLIFKDGKIVDRVGGILGEGHLKYMEEKLRAL
ncbi:MAG: thioredoxin family protein [Candidatus Thermoplasmatota archaeon]|nr:thioredoxin family protein [Candidatus Thermoplasmatota archaeon]